MNHDPINIPVKLVLSICIAKYILCVVDDKGV